MFCLFGADGHGALTAPPACAQEEPCACRATLFAGLDVGVLVFRVPRRLTASLRPSRSKGSPSSWTCQCSPFCLLEGKAEPPGSWAPVMGELPAAGPGRPQAVCHQRPGPFSVPSFLGRSVVPSDPWGSDLDLLSPEGRNCSVAFVPCIYFRQN